MKIGKTFYIHLLAGLVYLALISLGTWSVSGGDISYWIFSSIFLVIHLSVILLTKSRVDGFKAWIIVLVLVITVSFTLKQIYLNRDIKEGIQFHGK